MGAKSLKRCEVPSLVDRFHIYRNDAGVSKHFNLEKLLRKKGSLSKVCICKVQDGVCEHIMVANS